MKEKHKIVEIDFIDLENDAGWFEYSKDMHSKIKPLKAFGILVARDEHWISIAFARNPNGKDWLGRFSIPMSVVKKVTVIGTRVLN